MKVSNANSLDFITSIASRNFEDHVLARVQDRLRGLRHEFNSWLVAKVESLPPSYVRDLYLWEVKNSEELDKIEKQTDLLRAWLARAPPSTLIALFPEILLPEGFDSVRFAFPDFESNLRDEVATSSPTSRDYKGFHPFDRRFQLRSISGAWYSIGEAAQIVYERQFPGTLADPCAPHRDSHERQFLKELVAHSSSPYPGEIRLPHMSGLDAPLIQVVSASVLDELTRGVTHLESLHWRQLEELVADLLSDLGLQVFVTPASNDGGRDVIARGELIPGEPTILAVEVKHKKVAGITDLRQALWANRNFPALLFATSGRFSAGVFKEKQKEETQLRLMLKDGVGLTQWIDEYARRRLGHKPPAFE